MKASVFIILFVFYSVECRKVYKPLDKNANVDFINMESGAPRQPPQQPVVQLPPKTPVGPPQPTGQPAQGSAPTNPPKPAPAAPTPKPVSVTVPLQPSPVVPSKPQNTPGFQTTTAAPKPQVPNQIKPVPVNPPPAVNPITTPGYGTVKQLVNFYDSQGKASPIRPYSYSQAVKQGK